MLGGPGKNMGQAGRDSIPTPSPCEGPLLMNNTQTWLLKKPEKSSRDTPLVCPLLGAHSTASYQSPFQQAWLDHITEAMSVKSKGLVSKGPETAAGSVQCRYLP